MSFIAHLLTDFSKPATGEAPPFLKQASPEAEPEPKPQRKQVDDTTALIRAAEMKARNEEREIAEKNLAEALAVERARFEEELAAQRATWVEQESLQLALQWAEAFASLENQVSNRVAKILNPFLAAAYHEQAIFDLTETLRSVLSSSGTKVIKVSGPEEVLSAVRDRLGRYGEALELLPNGAVEIAVVADDTMIETQLQAWSSGLGEILKAG